RPGSGGHRTRSCLPRGRAPARTTPVCSPARRRRLRDAQRGSMVVASLRRQAPGARRQARMRQAGRPRPRLEPGAWSLELPAKGGSWLDPPYQRDLIRGRIEVGAILPFTDVSDQSSLPGRAPRQELRGGFLIVERPEALLAIAVDEALPRSGGSV